MFSICSFVFCDFGEKFTVYDTNGEPLRECIVSFVSQEEEGVVTVHDDQRHDLEDGDLVTFAEIEVCIICVCVCVCMCVCVCVCACACACVCACAFVCVCMCACVCVRVRVCVCMCVCLCVCVCVCV